MSCQCVECQLEREDMGDPDPLTEFDVVKQDRDELREKLAAYEGKVAVDRDELLSFVEDVLSTCPTYNVLKKARQFAMKFGKEGEVQS